MGNSIRLKLGYKTNQVINAPCAVCDKPWHQSSQIRTYALKNAIIKRSSHGFFWGQRRLCSDWADEQVDLSFCLVHRPRGYKRLFSCSTQLSTKFQLLLKLNYLHMKKFLALSLSEVLFIMLINVKMPTIVGILTFMSRVNFVIS